MIESLVDSLQLDLTLTPELQARLLGSLIIILVLAVLRFLMRRVIAGRFQDDVRALYTWRKVTEYVVVVLGVFLVGRIWIQGIQSLATFLGLLSAGLAIALRDLIIHLAGWAFLMWRRPFTVGDRIQIADHAGDVIDIRLFEFSLLEISNRIDAEQSTGRIIHIPNGKVFTDTFANYSQGLPHIWNEVPVLITFESDWEKAKTLLVQIAAQDTPQISEDARRYARRAAKRFVITYNNVMPTVYTEVASSGVRLTVRYLVDPRQRRDSEQTIWEAILRAFAQHDDIDFAYETRRQYRHWEEKRWQMESRMQEEKLGDE